MLRQRDETEIVQRPTSPRKCGANCWRAMATRRSIEGGLSVRTSLDPALAGDRRRVAARRARSPMTAAMAIAARCSAYRRRAATGSATLGAVPLPAGAAMSAGSSPSCCGASPSGASIGFADGTQRGAHPDRRELALGAPRACRGRHVCWSGVPAGAGRPSTSLQRRRRGRWSRTRRRAAAPTSPSRSIGLRQIPEVSGALVALDPHTGRVLAEIGGFSYEIEPVRPRDPGEAPDRLGDQAVRLSRRARSRLHALDAACSTGRSSSIRGRACRNGTRPTTSTNSSGRCRYPRRPRGIAQPRDRARRHRRSASTRSAQYLERFGIIDHVPHGILRC